MPHCKSEKVTAGLAEAENFLAKEFSTGLPEMADIAKHAISSGGKRLRPMVFLAAAGLTGTEPASVADVAAAIEMIHTASLLHDDVVDSATLRRGKPAVRDWWGDKASILAGDLIWCRASQIFFQRDIGELIGAATRVVTEMTEGQMLELRHMNDAALEKKRYMEMIELKTASLFSFSARAGSIISGGCDESTKALSSYGRGVGLAFQLIDDAMDYTSDEVSLGKPCMVDLRDGKSTYPFIVAMERLDAAGQGLLKDAIQSKKTLGPSSLIDRARDAIIGSGAVEETYLLATEFTREARESLQAFEDGEFKQLLVELADQIVEAGVRE
jgi:octaprenyl-diphosphate synthase